MFLIGFAVILIGFWFYAMLLGGQTQNFIDVASLLGILLPLVGVLAATRSFGVFYAGLRAVVFPKEEITEEMRGRAASLFRLLSKAAAMAAGISVLISFVNLLMNLDFSYHHPWGVTILGINMAASMISLIYGLLLIAAVFEPIVFILKKRYTGKR